MRSWSRTGILSVLVLVLSVVEAFAYGVTTPRNIEYAEHDGVKLHGEPTCASQNCCCAK